MINLCKMEDKIWKYHKKGKIYKDLYIFFHIFFFSKFHLMFCEKIYSKMFKIIE
jgi:hypothetical protein